jgi:hypothetical protein
MLLHINALVEGCVEFDLFLNAIFTTVLKFELVLKVLPNG